MPQLKISRLESVPNEFTSSVDKSQKDVFKEIQIQIDRIERKAGKIVISKKNLLLVQDIGDKLKNAIYQSSYITAVKKFVDEFDKQAAINEAYFAKEFFEVTASDAAKQIVLNYKRKALESLVGDGLTVNFITPAKDILENAVAVGSGWNETVSAIQDFALGQGETDGKLLRYSKGIASDLFAIPDRAFTNALSNEIGAQWFKYSGDVIRDSREFCVERHEHYFHKKEIEAWASLEWQGKRPDTTQETIFNLAGGYSCKHSILPVSVFRVPMDVIKRNIESGNYKPTDKEKKELNLM